MSREKSSFWKPIIEKMEEGLEARFSWEWFAEHVITRQLLGADVRWGNTLDLGCGLGVRAIMLHEAKGCAIVGLDSDEAAIAYANTIASQRLRAKSIDVHFITGSWYEVPRPPHTFDSAILIAGIEHAAYPVAVLDELRRVVKDGGTVFVSVTENNFHADPSHMSSWSTASLRRLLSCYGAVESWVDDNVVFAILTLRSTGPSPRPHVVMCDLNTPDTYTPQWKRAFERQSNLTLIDLDQPRLVAGPKLIAQIVEECRGSDILHLGPGANFPNIAEVLSEVRREVPHIVISKWFGDIGAEHYSRDVLSPSGLFHQVFLASSSYLGMVASGCGQVHINSAVEPMALAEWIPWRERPLDILIASNAYSEERLSRINAYLPSANYSCVWVGDGSPNGRVARQDTIDLFGQARIVLNIEDMQYRGFAHHASTRCYVAAASGCIVLSTHKVGLDTLFDGGIVQLDDEPAAWHAAYRQWLDEADGQEIAEMIWLNMAQMYRYHTFDYKVYCILRHLGFAVERPERIRPPGHTEGAMLLGDRTTVESDRLNSRLRSLEARGLKCSTGKEAAPTATRAAPAPARISVDLGCGAVKPEGFIGADRYPLRGVDVILDLEAPLPFATDCIDFLVASHSLEHVANLIGLLQEIYRVCRDHARLYIVAPYASQGLNIANPYHRQVFNEHTPRFWSDTRWSPVPPAEYAHPHASEWGLATSDNSLPRMDLRCVKMEFFYFPEYRNLPEDGQRAARKKYLDVCDQIIYHLVVAKQPMDEAEMQEIASRTDFYESPYVAIRRLAERLEAQATELARATARISELEAEHTGAIGRISELEAQTGELVRAKARIYELEAQTGELVRSKARIHELEAQTHWLAELAPAARSMAAELQGLRRRRILRVLNRLPFRGDLRDQVAPAFTRLRDDSYLFTKSLQGYRLQVGGDLNDLSFASYPLDLRRPGLKGILLAATFDLPPSKGQVGIEIVSPRNEIILQLAKDAREIDPSQPLEFDFAPVKHTESGRFWLRVFTRDCDTPVRLFEWHRYRLFGLGPLQRSAFCGYIFEA